MTSYEGIREIEDLGETVRVIKTGKTRSKKEVEVAFYDAYLQEACGDEYGPIDYDAGYRAYLKEFKEDLISFINGEW